jgi:nucleotide-binding universal stress UspA family protein
MEENTPPADEPAGDATWPHGRYVVGMDGSEQSQSALRSALTLAELTGAHVEAVSAWTYPPFYGQGYVPTDPDLESDALSSLEDAVAGVVGFTKPSNLTTVLLKGIPTATLIEQSRGADLLILGSRGHGGFAGLLLGSVSAACAEHATCPVLIIHGPSPVPS